MGGPTIAIVGSADASREFNPPLKAPEQAKQAAAELGRELANHDCRIIVYSSDPNFIEADFVRGFASSPNAAAASIEVHHPLKTEIRFKEQQDKPELFTLRADPKTDWEASFYRSFRNVDGIVLIGGGRSTLITGLLALEYKIPLLAIAAFGGRAQTIWELMTPDNCLATQNEIDQLAYWMPNRSAQDWVQILLNQRQSRLNDQETLRRKQRAESFFTERTALLSVVFFIASIAIAVLGFSGIVKSYEMLIALLFFCPSLAGISGATVRTAFEWTQNSTSNSARSIVSTAALGFVIGGISGFLFIVAQLTTLPDVQGAGRELAIQQAQRLIPLALLIGFVGGLTLDSVVRKLITVDVIDTRAIAPSGAGKVEKPASDKSQSSGGQS